MNHRSTRSAGFVIAIVLALQTPRCVLAQAATNGPEVMTLRELGPALTTCWVAPEGTSGAELTVVLSLNRDGVVMGRPRISYAKLPEEPSEARSFVSAVLASLAACTPIRLSPGLGAAVAGRPLAIRFEGRSRRTSERRASLD